MNSFTRRVNYYETDKMGITHHSNYIRWMEEARVEFLRSIGYGLDTLEKDGVTSPVVSVECSYKRPTTFDDKIEISVCVEKYSGVRLTLKYEMKFADSGETAAIARSEHCFIDDVGKPLALKKVYPQFDEKLKSLISCK